jgi:O-antigen/teichoic acid export membrane protein
MNPVKRNVIANIVGKGAAALFSLIFVPLHLKYLGIEAYGLVGFYATIQAMFLLVDMGFSGAFTRAIAGLSVSTDKEQEIRDLCRTFEVLFLLLGGITALLIVVLSQPIAGHWVHPENISFSSIASTIGLMGVSIGLQFPFMIYQGGLLGLQRQSMLSGLNIAAGLLRGLGGLLVLMFVDSSSSAFVAWQVLVSSLPRSEEACRFNFDLIVPLWRFAAGIAGISVCSVVLMQADKLILSRMITLEQFGYYSLASMTAGIPFMLAGPINNAVYPRLTQLVVLKQSSELALFYHRACQITAVLVIPAGLFLVIFSKEFMLLWTGNPTVARNTHQLISILAAGSTLLAIMYIPYALQLAFSWTKLTLYFNISSIIILIPAMIWLTRMYGALGACIVWLLLNAAYVLGMIQLMHKRILPNEKPAWYRDDLGKPLCSVLLVMVISKLIVDPAMPKLGLAFLLILTLLISTFVAAMSAPLIRVMALARWPLWRSAKH